MQAVNEKLIIQLEWSNDARTAILCTILGECKALWGEPNEPSIYNIAS